MEHQAGNIFIRDNGGPHEVGWRMDGHTHNYDHVTYIVRGSYRVQLHRLIVGDDGRPLLDSDDKQQWYTIVDRVYEPGAWLLIRAEDRHSFECVEGPGTLHCLYSHRTAQGEVTQQATGWDRAYR